jgi:SAM-dependent methyltransferase
MFDHRICRDPPDLVYPIYARPPTLVERFALKAGFMAGFCPVCGKLTVMKGWSENFRETGFCAICRSSNRRRQIAYVLLNSLPAKKGSVSRSLRGLRNLNGLPRLSIYNTEAQGPLHAYLSKLPGYVCSEYFGPKYSPGEVVNGIRHEDLSGLSFPDNSFDIVISSDVFEHVPSPYEAHQEVLRVLKPGGRHIFTVPFLQTEYSDAVLAEPNGGAVRLLKPPIYHLNPLSPNGVLVYTLFSLEMLLRLYRIGFRAHMYRLYHAGLGILGHNGLVFEAIKPLKLVESSEDQRFADFLEKHREEIEALKGHPR